MKTRADMIVDLQFGSTGKGLIAGFLAETEGYDTVINANMPNAGHTFVNSAGRKWVHKVLPNGIVSPGLQQVMIGPGSIFNLSRLLDELEASKDILQGIPIIIHQDAVIVSVDHVAKEKDSVNHIASTMQGSAEAMIDKIRRNPIKDHRVINIGNLIGWPEIILVNNSEWLDFLYESENVLIEGAQGYSLGLNAGFWPYCTSRDCTPARFLADCGVPHNILDRVIGTARMHPIRVGNTEDGHSGGCYNDQKEITWNDLGVKPETTTVTGRVRRVFTFSRKQIEEAIMACQPDFVFLNFCNYDRDNYRKIVNMIQDLLDEHTAKSTVRFLGWGPAFHNVEIIYG